jgi:putative membrane protein
MKWFQLALQLRGSVAPNIFPRVIFFTFLGFLVSLLYDMGFSVSWQFLGTVITNVVFNLVLGLLLVFRTNTAYERFWEGRKLWGVLVVNIRNLARQIWVGVAEIEPSDREKKASALRLLGAFALATKLQLRKEPVNEELEALLTPAHYQYIKDSKTPPLKVATWIGEYIQQQHNRNCLNSNQLLAMNQLLDSMVEGFTGCDRISKTPIPLAYSIYLKRLLLIYCLALPFQCVGSLHWWTGVIVGLISFVLLGIEEIGNEIEDPFGVDPNDLPVDGICQTVLDNIEELTATTGAQEAEVKLALDVG